MKVLYGKQVRDRLEDRVEPARTAVLVVDMQNDFCTEGGMIDRIGADIGSVRAMIPRLARLLDDARRAGALVVFIKNRSRPDGRYNAPADLARRLLTYAKEDDLLITTEGSWGEEIVPELPLQPSDVTVIKHRPDAFERTQLGLILRSSGIESVVVTGTATFACVESTARRALMEDYYVTVVEDCVGATDPALQEASLTVMKAFFGASCVVTADDVTRAWQKVAAAAPAR